MNESPDKMSLCDFMEMSVQAHRDGVAQVIANAFMERCPVCEGHHYHADAISVSYCVVDDDGSDLEFIEEAIWFVCMDCGAVFETDDLVMHKDTKITGRLIQTTDDTGFIASVHEAVGYTK